MTLSNLQRVKGIFWAIFVLLFIAILATPFFITREHSLFFSEEVTETVCLLIELTLLFTALRYYSREVDKKEAEAFWLNSKLKAKEKELLSVLEHLGKVNVQISMIQELYGKIEVPTNRSHFRQILDEILSIVKSVTREDWVGLRLINVETGRTLSEYNVKNDSLNEKQIEMPSNRQLVQFFRKKRKGKIGENQIFYSSSEHFSIKAFVVIPDKKVSSNRDAERNFLEAVANECEIMFLLFTSEYYKHYQKNKK